MGTLLSTYRRLWTDNLLAKRRRAAYSGTQTPRNTPAPPSKLITLLKPLICFRIPTQLAKQSMCDSNCRQNRVGQRRNRPRLRGIRLTYAESKRVTDGARTRALRSHNPMRRFRHCSSLPENPINTPDSRFTPPHLFAIDRVEWCTSGVVGVRSYPACLPFLRVNRSFQSSR